MLSWRGRGESGPHRVHRQRDAEEEKPIRHRARSSLRLVTKSESARYLGIVAISRPEGGMHIYDAGSKTGSAVALILSRYRALITSSLNEWPGDIVRIRFIITRHTALAFIYSPAN